MRQEQLNESPPIIIAQAIGESAEHAWLDMLLQVPQAFPQLFQGFMLIFLQKKLHPHLLRQGKVDFGAD